MSVKANLFFAISILIFLSTLAYILDSTPFPVDDAPSSGQPVPKSTYIGKGNCPVGCRCFPKQKSDGTVTSSQTFCAYIDNNTVYECPKDCCTPSCF